MDNSKIKYVFGLKTLVAIFLLITSYPAIDVNSAVISNSSVTQYLGQNTILALKEDSIGMLWISTPLGVFRFNGNQLVDISIPHIASPGPVSSFRHIVEDQRGYIWLGSDQGEINVYNVRTGIATNLEHSHDQRGTQAIVGILPSKDGSVIIVGSDVIQTGISEGSEPQLEIHQDQNDRRLNNISAICYSSDGDIWLASRDGISKFDPIKRQIITYGWPNDSQLRSIENDIIEISSSEEKLIIGTRNGLLAYFDKNSFEYSEVWKLDENEAITITDIAYQFDAFWVATDKGLFKLNENFEISFQYTHKNSRLSNDHITYLLPTEETLWIGTYQGLDVLTKSFFEIYNQENSDIHNEVMGFTQSRDGSIWVATYDGLYKTSKKDNFPAITHELVKSANSTDDRIMAVSAQGDSIWLAHRAGGLSIFDSSKGNWREVSTELNHVKITEIFHSNNNLTWIGTFSDGLLAVSRNLLNSNKNPKIHKIGETIEKITSIERIAAGKLLVAGEQSVYIVSEKELSANKVDLLFPESIYPTIYVVRKISDNSILLGTSKHGLFIAETDRLDDHTLIFRRFHSSLEAEPMTIYSIEEDSFSNLWISSNTGIHKYSLSGKYLRGFSITDGLQAQDFNFSSSFYSKNGNMYFGGSNGYNRFTPFEKLGEMRSSDIVLTEVRILGNLVSPPVPPEHLKEIHLSYKDYYLSLKFSVLDFLEPSKNRYRYKLEGFDPDWIENGTHNGITYTNLPAGRYRLHVQGANSAGIWNRDGVSLDIIKQEAPWYTWWAYCAYALTAMCILWLLWKYAQKSFMISKATELAGEYQAAADKAIEDLHEQLDYQAGLLINVRHHNQEVFNLINNCLRRESDCGIEPRVKNSRLGSIKRVEALAVLETCLLYQDDILLADIRKYVDSITPLILRDSPVPPDTISIINEINVSNVSVTVATPLSVVLYELMSNIIQHAFIQDRPANFAFIGMDRIYGGDAQTPYYIVTARDDGIGLPDQFKVSAPDSGGLAIVSDFSAKLGWTLDIDNVSGTKVTIRIPMERELTPGHAGKSS